MTQIEFYNRIQELKEDFEMHKHLASKALDMAELENDILGDAEQAKLYVAVSSHHQDQARKRLRDIKMYSERLKQLKDEG